MHEENHYRNRVELVLFSDSNPRALANMVPEPMSKLMKDLWKSDDSALLKYTEKELFEELYRRKAYPCATDSRLRAQFWLEYDRLQSMAIVKHPKMDMAYVIGKVVAKEFFYKYHITNPLKLAWLICPPTNYLELMHEVMHFSLNKIRMILESNHLKPSGELDMQFLNYVMNIHKNMHNNLNATVGGTKKKTKEGEEEDGPTNDPDAVAAEKRRKLEEYKKLLEQQQPEVPKDE